MHPSPAMSACALFDENLEAIERAIASVCAEVRLWGAEAEDFASSSRLALLANECAILRKFEGRSSLVTYLTIVVRRLFFDARRAAGRWYPSAEAERRGPAAVLLERLMMHERRTFAETAEIVCRAHPGITPADLEALAEGLPARVPRPLIVPIEDGDDERLPAASTAAGLVDALELRQQSSRANEAIRAALADMTVEDRVILRLRFIGNTTIAGIARSLAMEPRPLYRRIEALLARLRRGLEAAGVDAASADALIGHAGEILDFGLERKNPRLQPSSQEEGR
jgi:RNA polymerase sigma factor (sigma-70 family)